MTSSWNPIAPQILHKELDKVHATLDLATKAKQDSSEFAKNGLDPFIATIAAGAAGSWETWEIAERTRQIQKALENEIGAFHQRLLGQLPGWETLSRTDGQPDLVCASRKLFVELKNKHNTVSGKDLVLHYDNLLRNATGQYKSWIGAFAYIVDKPRKSPMGKPAFFTPADNKTNQKKPQDSRVITMNGRILWAIATDPRPGVPPPPYPTIDAIDQVLRMVQEYASQRYPTLPTTPHRIMREFVRSLGAEQ